MGLKDFLIVIAVVLFFLIPSMKQDKPKRMINKPIEAQEEQNYETRPTTFNITFEAKTEKEKAIADILWLRKVALFAKNIGAPYFDVLEQNINKKLDKKTQQEVIVVTGLVALREESTNAQFDAYEIETLGLTAED